MNGISVVDYPLISPQLYSVGGAMRVLGWAIKADRSIKMITLEP